MLTTPTGSNRLSHLSMIFLIPLAWVQTLAAASPRAQGMAVPAKPEPSAPSVKLPQPANLHGMPNLSLLKEKMIAYHDCTGPRPCYTDDLASAGRRAMDYLRRFLKANKVQNGRDAAGRPLAIVLDIDETAISNWENIRGHDFGFSRDEYLKWQQAARAPAIQPTLELFRFAQENHLAVFFLTGRSEAEREWTVKDLESAGYRNWTRLITRQASSPRFAVNYKSAERKKLMDAGYRIILNMGDQDSDLTGGSAEKTVKLPNPFYYVR